jgi:hypothetical protein
LPEVAQRQHPSTIVAASFGVAWSSSDPVTDFDHLRSYFNVSESGSDGGDVSPAILHSPTQFFDAEGYDPLFLHRGKPPLRHQPCVEIIADSFDEEHNS